jgi:hypothetical protein
MDFDSSTGGLIPNPEFFPDVVHRGVGKISCLVMSIFASEYAVVSEV